MLIENGNVTAWINKLWVMDYHPFIRIYVYAYTIIQKIQSRYMSRWETFNKIEWAPINRLPTGYEPFLLSLVETHITAGILATQCHLPPYPSLLNPVHALSSYVISDRTSLFFLAGTSHSIDWLHFPTHRTLRPANQWMTRNQCSRWLADTSLEKSRTDKPRSNLSHKSNFTT